MLKISIITVVRNDKRGLIKTEKSILSQSFKNFEWVVIDGNSSDGTKEYLTKLKYTFTNIISENDRGIYDAMNKGIRISEGDYLVFLNAGDEFFNSETLSVVYDKLASIENVDVLFGGADIYFDNDNYIYRSPQDIDTCINFSLPGHHQATYYSKNILDKIEYPLEYEHSGDYAIICILYKNGIKTININESLTKFVIGHHSFKNKYKILYYSSKVQKNILQLSNLKISISFIRRLFSTLIVQITYKYTFLTKVLNIILNKG